MAIVADPRKKQQTPSFLRWGWSAQLYKMSDPVHKGQIMFETLEFLIY